jgi:hypothetical protein
MEADKSNSNVPQKLRVRMLALWSLYLAMAGLIFSAVMSLAFYINGNFGLSEVKGPSPAAGFIARISMSIGFYVLAIALGLGLISLIVIPFRKPRLKNLVTTLVGLGIAIVAWNISGRAINRVRSLPARFCGMNMERIGKALKKYTEEHDGRLPAAANWCGALLDNSKYIYNSDIPRLSCFYCRGARTPKGQSSYALNESTGSMRLAELPGDVILVFETMPSENPVGGRELITADNHDGKGSIVLFGDLHVAFLKAEDFNDLRWEP